MSANFETISDGFAEQLASFDDQLGAAANDLDMLADIQQRIGTLLASNRHNEAAIRGVLQERYAAGKLRKETFQLVKSMLDRFASEDATFSGTAGAPGAPPVWQSPSIMNQYDDAPADDDFGTTTVIANDTLAVETADSRVQVGSLLRDRFLLKEKMSGGSMGVVYKALDRRLAEAGSEDPWVAVKVLSPQLARNGQALRALQQEAAKGRCLIHPNIVRFIDLDRDDDLYFLVMEWLDGRTLASILDSADAKTIDRDAALRIVNQIGDALEYAHRCGIVHADVKPANIMIMPNGDAKLFDFGVARVQQQNADSELDNGILGAMTPAYSSMQVLTGDEPVASDDVFALACLLYRLIAGYRVFGPRNAAEASQEGMKAQRPQGLADGEWRAVKKALSYARVTRFDSVQGFLDALRVNSDDTINLDPADRILVGGEPVRRSNRAFALFVIMLGLLGGALYQFGVLDPWLSVLRQSTGLVDAEVVDEAVVEVEVVAAPPLEAPLEVSEDDGATETVADEPAQDTSTEPETVAVDQEPLIDFSKLPPADVEIPFAIGAAAPKDYKIRLREDGRPVTVDFVRSGTLALPLTLKLDEIGFSGNRSPWGSRQYSFSDIVRFPAGQERSRIRLKMASDPLREADQVSTLRLREVDFAQSELAVIYVTLEDDDQRAFESRLPANQIGFAASQVSIQESNPAVQVDLIRFNPDNSRVVTEFTINDVTATEGADYFAPSSYSVTFGPEQRSARLLIPLVQDSLVEGDEAFVIELAGFAGNAVPNVFQRLVVMIRDDEPQPR